MAQTPLDERRWDRGAWLTVLALAAFAAVARSETDISQLSTRLAGTVQAALLPQEISLWLQKDDSHR